MTNVLTFDLKVNCKMAYILLIVSPDKSGGTMDQRSFVRVRVRVRRRVFLVNTLQAANVNRFLLYLVWGLVMVKSGPPLIFVDFDPPTPRLGG